MEIYDEGNDSAPGQDFDTIDTEIVIDTDIETAWALVSEPGWWINGGPLGDHDIDQDDDGLYHVSDPEVGTWLVEKADEDPMDVISFRWYPLAGDEFPEDHTTLVEFSLSEEDGGVILHVNESGLSSVSEDPDVCRQAWDDNAGGWDEMLAAAKTHLEG